MADIQTGRWGRIAQAAFNLKQALTLGQALPDVLPVFDLNSPDPSLRYHANDDYASAYVGVPAVAAQYGQAILQLPANAGRILVIEDVIVSCAATTGFQVTIGGASVLLGSAPVSYSQFRDTRRSGRPSGTVRYTSSVALGPNPGAQALALANTPARFEGPWIMSQTPVSSLPSPYLVVECGAVNTVFYATFRWRERTMEPAEYRVS